VSEEISLEVERQILLMLKMWQEFFLQGFIPLTLLKPIFTGQ
jgi:hypothetical protein